MASWNIRVSLMGALAVAVAACAETPEGAEPVGVRGFLEQQGLTVKRGVAPLTELLADGIQSMLEELTSQDPGPS